MSSMISIADIEKLKQTLEKYEIIKGHQTQSNIISFIDGLIIKIKQDIFNAYIWSEIEIIEKITLDKNPDAIDMYFI